MQPGTQKSLHGIEARRERYPYVIVGANESEIAETTNSGINQFPVHEAHPMTQHQGYFRYVQAVYIP